MVIRTVTLEDFEAFINQPEHRDSTFEFIDGRIVEVVSNNLSSQIAMFIGAMILVFVLEKDLGWVTGADGGYRVAGERYIPDVGFISKVRQPAISRAAYNPLAPDLAVEVLSPGNDAGDIRIKIVNYLRAGTTVWLVDPEAKQVEVYTPGEAPRTLYESDTLNGGAVLPGFTLAVKALFQGFQ
ncbi:MAG: Uma2 family endonuclease [Anaerolineae bacterium]